jgi:hypothetical protein
MNRRRFIRSLIVAPAVAPIALVAASRAAPAAVISGEAIQVIDLAKLIMAGNISVNHARAILGLAPLEGGNFILRHAGKGPIEWSWPLAGVLRR